MANNSPNVPLNQPAAPVAPGGNGSNTLSAALIVDHLWQEHHVGVNAPASAYAGPTNEDRKVVERQNTQQELQAKQRLHLCFQEKAVITFRANVPQGTTCYARWQIIDAAGTVVFEHPGFSAANYANSNAAARLTSGSRGLRWDGRNSAPQRVYCVAGAYRSRLTVKASDNTQIHESFAPLALEGQPYRIFICGQPKSDEELRTEFQRAALQQRYLDTNGQRTARDCWIKVCRGLDEEGDAADDEGHVVFLGQGAQEATRVEVAATAGAVATPHDRWYKGWRRVRTWAGANMGVLQFEALGRTDGLIDLATSAPPANNPYCDALPNQPFKDGVQAHPGNTNWTTNGMSVGCTTVSPVTGGTPQAPPTARGNLQSVSATFGADADGLTTFTNKQTRRANQTADALLADDHGQPLLDQPEGLGEPVHMQPTAQQAIFGGFHGHEIPDGQAVSDEPTSQARIRLLLQDAPGGTLYYQYHHAVFFGHASESLANGSYQLTVWVPVKVIRGWNGNHRNLLVRERCQIAWYVERRRDGQDPVTMAGIEPNNANPQTFGALANVGRLRHTWTPTGALGTGRYVSVLRYRVELSPSGNQHDWEPEAAMNDLFSAGSVTLAAEDETSIANVRYLEGVSELVLVTVP